jgi:hypothetical protein
VAAAVRHVAALHGMPDRYHETITRSWVHVVALHRALQLSVKLVGRCVVRTRSGSSAAGLGAEDAADLMAVAATATPALEAQLAAGCSAVVTRRVVHAPFTALPAVAADALPGLRAAAVA